MLSVLQLAACGLGLSRAKMVLLPPLATCSNVYSYSWGTDASNGDFGGTQVRGGEQMSHIRRAGEWRHHSSAGCGGRRRPWPAPRSAAQRAPCRDRWERWRDAFDVRARAPYVPRRPGFATTCSPCAAAAACTSPSVPRSYRTARAP